MGLWDRLTGTKRPERGVAAASAEAVRAALLAVGGGEHPYAVEPGQGDELVGRWRVDEPAWTSWFLEREVSQTITVRMRLDADASEVRTVTEQWEVVRARRGLELSRGASYRRGAPRTVRKQFQLGRGGLRETWSFDSDDLVEPLRAAALERGWSWRVVPVGKL